MNTETELLNIASTYSNDIVIAIVALLGIVLLAVGGTQHIMRKEMRTMTNRQFRRWKSK